MQIHDWDPMSQPPLLFTRTNALTGEVCDTYTRTPTYTQICIHARARTQASCADARHVCSGTYVCTWARSLEITSVFVCVCSCVCVGA